MWRMTILMWQMTLFLNTLKIRCFDRKLDISNLIHTFLSRTTDMGEEMAQAHFYYTCTWIFLILP